MIEFSLLGKAHQANKRAEYRVSAVGADILVGLQDEPSCELVDISMSGCSVLATRRYRIGQVLQITLNHEGQTATGKVIVRNARAVGNKKIRCGLSAISSHRSKDFEKLLRQMTMALERMQLRRLSRC